MLHSLSFRSRRGARRLKRRVGLWFLRFSPASSHRNFPTATFPIANYGAKPDGTTDCTDAIRQAIAACHAAGGGRVIVSGGIFLTGAVHLLSGVNLLIAEGATLKFNPDPANYLPVVQTRFEGTECMNYSPLIYAFGQRGHRRHRRRNAGWFGVRGQLVGHDTPGPASPGARADSEQLIEQGERNVPVTERVFGGGHALRPSFIQANRCRNVLIEGVHIINSPMWELHPLLSTNVTVRGVSISSHGPNNDGCDPEILPRCLDRELYL